MLLHLAVFAAGLVAGFLNVMAGGGSLLTLPILIFLGLPAAVANGTNRVAILTQNVVAVASFRRLGYPGTRRGMTYALATVPGAVAGAMAAVRVDDTVFRAILAGVMLLTVAGLVVPSRRPRGSGHGPRPRTEAMAFAAFFGIGFYGGFLQAGVGFLLMLVLHQLLGHDLVRTNAHKVLIVLVFSVPALAVFVATGNVIWVTALVLAGGNAVGAVAATKVSAAGGERTIRAVVGVALLVMAARLVWP